MSEKFPHEMPEYQQVKREERITKELLLSDRDTVVVFEVEATPGTVRTLRFKRLTLDQYNEVLDGLRKLKLPDENHAAEVTNEQLEGLFKVQCLALGIASADGLGLVDWLELNDKRLTETCYAQLMDISGVSKKALENLNWFRHQSRG